MRCPAALVAVLLSVASLSAQQQAVTPEAVLARQLAKSALIRLHAEGARVTGHLTEVGQGQATLEVASGPRTIQLNLVDSVWVRGHAAKTGAIVGGTTRAIVLGVLTSLLTSGFCEVDCSNAGTNGALVGGAIGSAGGALLGAGVGALIPKWKRRFP